MLQLRYKGGKMNSELIDSISVKELEQSLKNKNIQLLDVREYQEVEIAYIEGFEVLPLSEFDNWSSQIQTLFNQNSETLVICHHGIRSAQVCHWLQKQGFSSVKNISGGIDAYSVYVDPSIPRY